MHPSFATSDSGSDGGGDSDLRSSSDGNGDSKSNDDNTISGSTPSTDTNTPANDFSTNGLTCDPSKSTCPPNDSKGLIPSQDEHYQKKYYFYIPVPVD